MHRKDSDQPRGVHLWLILWKAFAALQHHALRSIERLGLGYSDFGVLEVVLHKGPTPVNTIGEKVNLTSGSISVAVDRLEEDRRTRVVHLTAAGRRLIERAFACHAAAMEGATLGLSDAEREQAIGLLRKLGKAAALQSAQ